MAFLSGGAAPAFAIPEGNKMYWNPQVTLPVGDHTYDGTGFHNSGTPRSAAFSYSLTFTKPGEFEYWCLVHAEVGQRAKIIVQ